ncbi:MAG: right-handed parallel beta-helix repeat-containing protein, partial [Clostridia bacterium]|nr:right-handed parallel beta-helix repeat-containing protein [Clostridia bacterium]
GTFTAEYYAVYAGYRSPLTINGGTFTAEYYAVYAGYRSPLTINGGTFKSDYYYCVYVYYYSDAVINGGTFKSDDDYCVYVYYYSDAVINGGTFLSDDDECLRVEYSNLTVNGGTFTAAYDDALYVDYYSTVLITDGTFNGDDSAVYLGYYSSGTINGGTFNGEGSETVYVTNSSALTINGGTINSLYDDGIIAYNSSEITINDCTVNAECYAVCDYNSGTKITVNGGVFNAFEAFSHLSDAELTVNGGFVDAPLFKYDTQYLKGGYYTIDPTDYINYPGLKGVPTDETDEADGIDTNTYKYKITGETGDLILKFKYNLEGITKPAITGLAENAEITLDSVMPNYEITKDGNTYRFDGYYTDNTYTTPIEFPYVITDDTTFYGQYVLVDPTKDTYTVTIDYNGHGGKNKTVKNVPYGTKTYDVILAAFVGLTEYSQTYVDNIKSTGTIDSIIPTEKGYVLRLDKDDPLSIKYGLKSEYKSLDMIEEESDHSEFYYQVKKDTTYYLQWFKVIDEPLTVTAPEAVCGMSMDDYKAQVTVTAPKGVYAVSDVYNNNMPYSRLYGGTTAKMYVDMYAEFGYVFDSDGTTYNTPAGFSVCAESMYDRYGNYCMDQYVEWNIIVEHSWSEPVVMTDEEIAKAGLEAPEEGYKWAKCTCEGCDEVKYVEVPADEDHKTFTVTVDLDGRRDDLVIDNVKPGTKVYDAIGYTNINNVICRLYDFNTENFWGIASKPASEFATYSDLEADITETQNNLTVKDSDVTVYAIYRSNVNPVITVNSLPVCGDPAFDEEGVAVKADVTVADNKGFKVVSATLESQTDAKFTGGYDGRIDIVFAPNVNILIGQPKVEGIEPVSINSYTDEANVKHWYIYFDVEHVPGEEAEPIDELLDPENPCSPIVRHHKTKCAKCGELINDVPEILPVEHDWDTPTYVWADDLTTVTAKQVCKNNE